MRFAVPAVPIVKDQVRRIVGARAHTHEMLNPSARADDRTRVEHIDHGGDGKQIQLW